MSAYLLTWNPKNWPWADLPEIASKLSKGVPVAQRWSCGNSRKIPVGSRVFLLRQGVEPKGIIASGWVTSSPSSEPHWDPERAARGDNSFYIRFAADALLDPDLEQPLDVRGTSNSPLSELQVDAPASGNSIPEHVAEALAEAWAAYLGKFDAGLGKGDPELAAFEGEEKRRFINHRSRERALRDAKLNEARRANSDGRLRCEVPGCGFDFEAVYGSIGVGFAHVHHLRPLAEEFATTVTTLQDLAVVCANCHSIIHRGGECRTLETLIPLAPR